MKKKNQQTTKSMLNLTEHAKSITLHHDTKRMSRDMWFPTMCHFDKGRLRLLLSLETPNAVQSVA